MKIENYGMAVSHRKESKEIYDFISELDFRNGDNFCFKSGEDGDNGELLMTLLDKYFESLYISQTDKDKLASYESIGTVEEFKTLKSADEQGLLAKLPCKVGTHVYIVNNYWIDEGNICGLAECDDVDCACFNVYIDPDYHTLIAFDEFNKTWFLTEEEANEVLERMRP